MERRFFLNVVVSECSPVLQLFTCKYQSLLVRWNPLLVLYFSFHDFNRVTSLYIESDRFTCQSFHEDLHGLFDARETIWRHLASGLKIHMYI